MAVFLYLLQGDRFAKTFFVLVVFAFAPVAIGVFNLKQLFYNTGIPACLWFLRREKNSHSKEILFIDATEMGFMKDRVHRDLAPEDLLWLFFSRRKNQRQAGIPVL
jgi:hypothetical protein